MGKPSGAEGADGAILAHMLGEHVLDGGLGLGQQFPASVALVPGTGKLA